MRFCHLEADLKQQAIELICTLQKISLVAQRRRIGLYIKKFFARTAVMLGKTLMRLWTTDEYQAMVWELLVLTLDYLCKS
jgi:hypothetical protein